MITHLLYIFLAAFAVRADGEGDASRPLKVVPEVDLHRYVGTWYEIARKPNRFQSQCIGDVTATYTLLDDGDIAVVNRCRKEDGEWSEATGRARRTSEEQPNTKLKVRFAPAILSFLPFVWGDYWIILLAPDYSYAVIGEPDRKYLWILSRSSTMEEATFQEVLDQVKLNGYEVSDLVRTKHS